MIRPSSVNRDPRKVRALGSPSSGPLSPSLSPVISPNLSVPGASPLVNSVMRRRARAARSMLRSALWGATACGLTACLGPHYKRPDVPPPQAWRGAPAAQDGTAWPSADWWHGFNSVTLNDLMDQARTANDDIGAAVARIRQADAQARIAGAPLLPSVGVDADGNRQRAQQSFITPQGGLASRPATFNTFTAELSASYEIDFLGQESRPQRCSRGGRGRQSL